MHMHENTEAQACVLSAFHSFFLDVSAFNRHNKMSPLWCVSHFKKNKAQALETQGRSTSFELSDCLKKKKMGKRLAPKSRGCHDRLGGPLHVQPAPPTTLTRRPRWVWLIPQSLWSLTSQVRLLAVWTEKVKAAPLERMPLSDPLYGGHTWRISIVPAERKILAALCDCVLTFVNVQF